MGLPPVALLLLAVAVPLALALLARWRLGREALHRAVCESDTPAGRAIDALLLAAILLSVVAVVLESEPWVRLRWSAGFSRLEWGFTLLFTLEYLLRLLSAERPLRYAGSVFGVVDLLSILPTYAGLFLQGGQVFLVVRSLRLLRTFRVLKLGAYLRESELLWSAILAARRKIGVFLLTIVVLVTVIGALMYVIEGPGSAFRSIPVGIYWAVVTITTVGYGDVAPVTPLGRFLASAVMLLGYSIIAVPTGIITTELGAAADRRRQERPRPSQQPSSVSCNQCGRGGHDADARHCKHCGSRL